MLVGKITSDNELYQYFHDGLGSITMIVDSSGSYQNLYTYDDFGDFRKKDESVNNSYCYTGQERDEAPSGLYNLRARYYAAGMGRFTQEDPMFGMKNISSSCHSSSLSPLVFDEPQLINPYLYVTNNPIIWIDVTGLVRIVVPGMGFSFCTQFRECVDNAVENKNKAIGNANTLKNNCIENNRRMRECYDILFEPQDLLCHMFYYNEVLKADGKFTSEALNCAGKWGYACLQEKEYEMLANYPW